MVARFGEPIARFGEPLGKARGGGGGVLTLPASSYLAWWSAEQSVFADEALTTLSSPGGVVKGWMDLGASGYHVTRDNSESQCALKVVSGKRAVQFASSGYLVRNIAGSILAQLNAYALYIVFSTSITAADQVMYSEGRSSSGTPTLVGQTNTGSPGGRMSLLHRSNAGVTAAPVPAAGINACDGNIHVFTGLRTAANAFSIRLDGTEYDTDTNEPVATTIDRLALGAWVRSTIGTFFTGNLFQVILATSDNHAIIEPILGGYYGITMPPL